MLIILYYHIKNLQQTINDHKCYLDSISNYLRASRLLATGFLKGAHWDITEENVTTNGLKVFEHFCYFFYLQHASVFTLKYVMENLFNRDDVMYEA